MPGLSEPSAALPLYRQISRLLLREIMSGRLASGERLPPERDMAADLGISVGTLRRALSDLSDEGILERVQGSGNYIREDLEVSGIYSFFRLELRRGGGVPTARVCDVSRMPPPIEFPVDSQDQQAYRIQRMRFLDELPAALEEIWLDASRVDELRQEDLSQSLYRHYRSFGLWISDADDRVGVGTVPMWAPPEYLTPGASCGHVFRMSRAQDGRVAEISNTWFDPAQVVYRNRMT